MRRPAQPDDRVESSRALVSIHDVTPRTLDSVTDTLGLTERLGIRTVTLLVVAGAGWSQAEIDTLKGFAAKGYRLAGHGWTHTCAGKKTLWHKVHGAVLSRNDAEHMSRTVEEAGSIITRCFDWFDDAGLYPPSLYVPPAWALGAVHRGMLLRFPFRIYELLTGVFEPSTGRFYRLPLVGYEADTRIRRVALRRSNGVNRALARSLGRPLRIAIHPSDFSLPLGSDLLDLLSSGGEFVSYDELFVRS